MIIIDLTNKLDVFSTDYHQEIEGPNLWKCND